MKAASTSFEAHAAAGCLGRSATLSAAAAALAPAAAVVLLAAAATAGAWAVAAEQCNETKGQ